MVLLSVVMKKWYLQHLCTASFFIRINSHLRRGGGADVQPPHFQLAFANAAVNALIPHGASIANAAVNALIPHGASIGQWAPSVGDGSAGAKCTLLSSQDDVYPHCNVDIPQGGEDDEKMAAVAAMAPHRALNGDTLTTMAAMAFYSCLPF